VLWLSKFFSEACRPDTQSKSMKVRPAERGHKNSLPQSGSFFTVTLASILAAYNVGSHKSVPRVILRKNLES